MNLRDGAPWLATMRELTGVKEYAGGENNPTILGWAGFIGHRYPEMAEYAALYKSDDISWCGLVMAYVMAKLGIRPPFGAADTDCFLWANSFAAWGLRIEAPRPGCIVVFKWTSGGGHVGVLDRVEGKTLWVAGGNQSDAVNVMPFAWDAQVVGFFWPPAVAASPSAVRTPADVKMRMGKAITLAEARRENGHLAVYWLPANDGGGTYEVAGINERYHPVQAAKLKALIEAGQYLEAEDFVGQFTAAYTDVADLWTGSWGIEFYLRDCVFNRGPTGAAKILQRALIILGEDIGPDGVDGDIGPNTMAAIGRQETDVDAMLIALRQAREDYERYVVGVRANLWNGLINRFNNALKTARQFHTEQPRETPVAEETINDQVLKEIQFMRADFAQLVPVLASLVSALKGVAPVPSGGGGGGGGGTIVTASGGGGAGGAAESKPVTPPTTPILERPSVQTSIASAGIALLMYLLGVPVVGEAATPMTQAPLLASIASGALGLSGFGGGISNALSTVGSMFAQWMLKKREAVK